MRQFAAEPLEQPPVIQHLYRPSLEFKGFGEVARLATVALTRWFDAGEPKLAP